MKNSSFPDTPALEDDFAPHNDADWHAAAEKLLKGAPFEKVLLTRTPEDITLQPLYSRDNAAGSTPPETLPGFFPFLRGRTASGYHGRPWLVLQALPFAKPEAFNAALLHALANGQNAVLMQLPDGHENGTHIATIDDLATALQGVELTAVPLYLQAGRATPALLDLLLALLREKEIAADTISGGLFYDPIASALVASHPAAALEARLGAHTDFLLSVQEKLPDFHTFFIDTRPWHNAGGSAVQELAFGLAAVVSTLGALLQRGMAIDDSAGRVHMRFAVDSRFFMQIAKLRAARILFARALQAFGGAEATQRFFLHACSSRWNKTVFDPHVNLLRSTAEAQAAVLAGCDSLSIGAFDELVRETNDFSTRLARNLHSILREESHLDRVIDAAGGAWAVEKITRELAEKAWALFQQTEKSGGLIAALQEGWPQEQVRQKAAQRRQAIDRRTVPFIGTTVYANLQEHPLPDAGEPQATEPLTPRPRQQETIDRLLHTGEAKPVAQEQRIAAALAGARIEELLEAISEQAAGQPGSISPLPQIRAVEHFEAMRTAVRTYKQTGGELAPVFRAVFGSLSEYKARADFIADFFATVEFPVLPAEPCGDAQQTAQAAQASGAAIVVICASDARYPELVPEFMRHFKKTGATARVFIAGAENETLAATGIDGFIHRRSDAAALLRDLLQGTGVLA